MDKQDTEIISKIQRFEGFDTGRTRQELLGALSNLNHIKQTINFKKGIISREFRCDECSIVLDYCLRPIIKTILTGWSLIIKSKDPIHEMNKKIHITITKL